MTKPFDLRLLVSLVLDLGARPRREYGPAEGLRTTPLSLLLVDRDPASGAHLRDALRDCAVVSRVREVSTLASACEVAQRTQPDAILIDCNLVDSASVHWLSILADRVPSTPVLALTRPHDDRAPRAAWRDGAETFRKKHRFDGGAVVRAVCYAIARQHIEQRLLTAVEALEVVARVIQGDAVLSSYDLAGPLAEIVRVAKSLDADDVLRSNDEALLEDIVSAAFRIQSLTETLVAVIRFAGDSSDEPIRLGDETIGKA